jgi:hypothetical protein
MKELNLNLMFGIEIFLKYLSIFEQILEKGYVDVVNCSLSKEAVVSFRGEYGDEFYESYYDLMRFFFKGLNINIVDNQEYPTYGVFDLQNMYGVRMDFKIREDFIKEYDLGLPEKYITVSTKSMNSLPIDMWNNIKEIFIQLLNEKECPIILLGERKIKQCKEYDIHSAFTIYDDLINGLYNYIDKTIEDTTKANDIEDMQKTFFILNKSSLNIYLSDGGIKTIALSCSQNVYGLGLTIYDQESLKHEDITNILQTRDLDVFLHRIANFKL